MSAVVPDAQSFKAKRLNSKSVQEGSGMAEFSILRRESTTHLEITDDGLGVLSRARGGG